MAHVAGLVAAGFTTGIAALARMLALALPSVREIFDMFGVRAVGADDYRPWLRHAAWTARTAGTAPATIPPTTSITDFSTAATAIVATSSS